MDVGSPPGSRTSLAAPYRPGMPETLSAQWCSTKEGQAVRDQKKISEKRPLKMLINKASPLFEEIIEKSMNPPSFSSSSLGQNDNSSVPPSQGHPSVTRGDKKYPGLLSGGCCTPNPASPWVSPTCARTRWSRSPLSHSKRSQRTERGLELFPLVSPCTAKWWFQMLVPFQHPLHFSSVLT